MTEHESIAPAVNSAWTGRRIAKLRSKRMIAFGWYGGKFSHLGFLLPHTPKDATHFCDVFGGSAAVLFNVAPYRVETYSDLDSELLNFSRRSAPEIDFPATRTTRRVGMLQLCGGKPCGGRGIDFFEPGAIDNARVKSLPVAY